MGRMKEYGYRPELGDYFFIEKKGIPHSEGQINFTDIQKKPDLISDTSELKKNTLKNIILPVNDENLPVEKRYLNLTMVAFMEPNSITRIRDNIYEISKGNDLVVANKFSKKNDEELVNGLVVFSHGTNLYDFHDQTEIVLGGNIVALPVITYGDYGPEQRFIYIGNSSTNESVNNKKNTRYHPGLNLSVWRTMILGTELPSNDGKALRVKISVNGINEIKKI